MITKIIPSVLTLIVVGGLWFTPYREAGKTHAYELDSHTHEAPRSFACYTRPASIHVQGSGDDLVTVTTPGDSSLPQVNKQFLILLHMVQDSLGNYPLDDAGLNQVRTAIRGSSDLYSRIGISFEASDSVYFNRKL